MKTLQLFSALILLSVFWDQSTAADPTFPCNADWEPFEDDTICYKITDKSILHSFEDAEKICQQAGATLLNIRSKEEQNFLVNLLFVKNKIVDNVWLGANYEVAEKKFKWTQDNSTLTYTNWFDGSQKNLTDYCVQMHSDVGSVGKWVDEPCQKKYLVVCQKEQILPIAKIQDILLELRQVVRDLLPIGFIYVQLPSEKSPSSIWPSMEWTDVSSVYAGVFFRVEGGGAATFGQVQGENAPRLVGVDTGSSTSNNALTQIKTPTGGRSAWMRSQYPHFNNGTHYDLMDFTISSGEVRPKNMAIRVWKRSA